MDSRNTIIAIVVSIAILLGWDLFFAPKAPPPAEPTAATSAPAAPPASPGDGAQPPVAAPATGGAPTALAAAPESSPAPRVRVATPHLHGSIALTGARLDDITLVNYRERLDPASPEIVLLAPAGASRPSYAEWGWLTSDTGVSVPGPNTEWTAADPAQPLTDTQPLVLTWDNGQGLIFTRTIRADKEYLFTIEQGITNNSDRPVSLYPYSLVVRLDGSAESGLGMAYLGPVGVFDQQLREVKYNNLKEKGRETYESTGGWIGISDHYWLTAVAFDSAAKVSGSFNYASTNGRDRFQTDLRADAISVAPGETKAIKSYVFAGAKELNLLEEYRDTLGLPLFDRAIDFGWYWFLTIPFFHILRYLNAALGNFGLAILGLAFVVRLLMFPIANKQFNTMNKLKKLQPEMKRLQERYANDRPKMNQELMELYKREKANPLAGCLPILIQIPVFYALYKVLSVTIEMRHAPFYGWIHDLSAPDPTSVLNVFGLLPFQIPAFLAFISIGAWPLIMGITMYIQQKLSPQPADPMQAKIMMLMPIIITFVLAPYAAGLVIYWAWSNLLGILQQWVLLKRGEAQEAKASSS